MKYKDLNKVKREYVKKFLNKLPKKTLEHLINHVLLLNDKEKKILTLFFVESKAIKGVAFSLGFSNWYAGKLFGTVLLNVFDQIEKLYANMLIQQTPVK